ncbi:MAG: DUF4426 domain-containing protein [Halofilum sp. (in: g-proteobacteria)]|nr:DUF4426 domain-containing protein [Halofilum sp. (in: g-proteobacteria)]
MLRTPCAHLLLTVVLLGAGAGVSAGEWAAAMRDTGEYTIHYNAMPASALEPWVAERYGLPRTDDHCVVTVAVIDNQTGKPVDAAVTVSAVRADGRMYQLEMRPITDAGAMYYVGEAPLESAGAIDFTLQVRPRQAQMPATVRFQREFPGG